MGDGFKSRIGTGTEHGEKKKRSLAANPNEYDQEEN